MSANPNWQVITGDCLDVMRGMDANSVDTIITDPPAAISFMGKSWDSDRGGRSQWVAWLTEVMAEGLRVLKPGGMALVWALPRTSHWTALAVEDAGFEIREKIYHLFGSGFPKSHSISKAIDREAGAEREVLGVDPARYRRDNDNNNAYSAHVGQTGIITAPATPAAQEWDGWGTALKPAAEEWIVAMKPLSSTFAANALEWGVAGLWIDGARVGTTKDVPASVSKSKTLNAYGNYKSGGIADGDGFNPNVGRWPANVIHDGSAEVLAGFPVTVAGGSRANTQRGQIFVHGGAHESYGDTGSAARYFYCAKASRAERNAGLEGMESVRANPYGEGREGVGKTGHYKPRQNIHPTVKPIALLKYLCRLTKTPTGGVVLDPFAGSGSTGCAAVMEGRSFIGIELSDEYAEIARARIAHAEKQVPVAEQGSLL